ncbi:UNVERIFIED_CONTAM: hypothetical protein GTU68_049561 [Idotea baltica]|nr:hypothetical protein [Idotea baltica]
MGLAPYGNPDDEEVKRFNKLIKEHLIDLSEDGSIWLNQKYFNYATGLRMVFDSKWEKLFGLKKRQPEDEFDQHHCNMAMAIQQVTEETVVLMAKEAQRLTGSKNLCLAGGVALNCVSNGKLQKQDIFENIYIQPAAGDAGGALGCALAAHHIYFDAERAEPNGTDDTMQGSYLGPSATDSEIKKMINKYNAVKIEFEEPELYKQVAQLLADGKVVGWMQGRMEFGPRALGARSILGDARNPEMQKKLNLKIKYRESFRPFAPSVLNEDRNEYFDLETASPYMLLVHPVKETRRHPLPAGYHDLGLKDKLYHLRSDIPSITHIDFSARIQTVHEETNPKYWKLIRAFKELTGYALLVNTSFNVRGEPIVCTPDDAYRCFMRTEMDYLVIENGLYSKVDQPNWAEKDNWKEEFVLD